MSTNPSKPYENHSEYYNEFEKHLSVPQTLPSLRVVSYYSIDHDISNLSYGDFWTFVSCCVNRPAKYRRMLTEKLLSETHAYWYSIIKPHLLKKDLTFNSLVRSGAELDAFSFTRPIVTIRKLHYSDPVIWIHSGKFFAPERTKYIDSKFSKSMKSRKYIYNYTGPIYVNAYARK
ncbi:hypothetical protein RF11_16474 [Thelohanellus kitauei]|uniref:Uncharacterized protein n=1 Tax=Thelohanellus kitauei TaxID=669202 RepID=A0A0C2JW41_THEKT|nr:hypothetical protein RF11_16474 [Thelohanellus kitauei]